MDNQVPPAISYLVRRPWLSGLIIAVGLGMWLIGPQLINNSNTNTLVRTASDLAQPAIARAASCNGYAGPGLTQNNTYSQKWTVSKWLAGGYGAQYAPLSSIVPIAGPYQWQISGAVRDSNGGVNCYSETWTVGTVVEAGQLFNGNYNGTITNVANAPACTTNTAFGNNRIGFCIDSDTTAATQGLDKIFNGTNNTANNTSGLYSVTQRMGSSGTTVTRTFIPTSWIVTGSFN